MPPSGKTIHRMFSRYKNGMDLLCNHAEYGMVIEEVLAGFTPAGEQKMSVFLFVCPFLNGRVCDNDFAMKEFKYGNALNIIR